MCKCAQAPRSVIWSSQTTLSYIASLWQHCLFRLSRLQEISKNKVYAGHQKIGRFSPSTSFHPTMQPFSQVLITKIDKHSELAANLDSHHDSWKVPHDQKFRRRSTGEWSCTAAWKNWLPLEGTSLAPAKQKTSARLKTFWGCKAQSLVQHLAKHIGLSFCLFPQTCLERRFWRSVNPATTFLPMPCILSRRLTSSRPWIIKASRIRFTTLRSFNARHTPGLVTSEPNSLISFRQLPIALTCRAGVDFPSHVSHYVTMLQSHRNTVGSGH